MSKQTDSQDIYKVNDVVYSIENYFIEEFIITDINVRTEIYVNEDNYDYIRDEGGSGYIEVVEDDMFERKFYTLKNVRTNTEHYRSANEFSKDYESLHYHIVKTIENKIAKGYKFIAFNYARSTYCFATRQQKSIGTSDIHYIKIESFQDFLSFRILFSNLENIKK